MSDDEEETVGRWFFAPAPPPEPVEVLEVAEKNLEEPPRPESTEAEFSEPVEETVAEAPTEPVSDEAPGEIGRPQDGTVGAHATGALGAPESGTLGAIDDLYYRRVWQWSGSSWDVVLEGPVRTIVAFQCQFEGPTWCKPPTPYIAERWWKYAPGTIGSGSSADWQYAGDRQNWG